MKRKKVKIGAGKREEDTARIKPPLQRQQQ